MSPGRPFVVITSQRTGSTLLVRSIDASPEILCAGEIFYRGAGIHHPEMQYPHRLLGSSVLARAVDSVWGRQRVERHLTRFYTDACTAHAAAGFKVMVSQLRMRPAVLPWLLGHNVAMFYLYRRDAFSTALSYCKARKSGVYHGDKARGHGEAAIVELDATEFRKVFDACRADQSEILRLYDTYGGHLFEYEDLVDRWDEVIDVVGRAVGLPTLRVCKALPKLESGFDRVQISNERALRRICNADTIL